MSGTITVPNTGTAANLNNIEKTLTKKSAPFTSCVSEISSAQIDNAKDNNIEY